MVGVECIGVRSIGAPRVTYRGASEVLSRRAARVQRLLKRRSAVVARLGSVSCTKNDTVINTEGSIAGYQIREQQALTKRTIANAVPMRHRLSGLVRTVPGEVPAVVVSRWGLIKRTSKQ